MTIQHLRATCWEIDPGAIARAAELEKIRGPQTARHGAYGQDSPQDRVDSYLGHTTLVVRGTRLDLDAGDGGELAGQVISEIESRLCRQHLAYAKAANERMSFENVVWVGANEVNRLSKNA